MFKIIRILENAYFSGLNCLIMFYLVYFSKYLKFRIKKICICVKIFMCKDDFALRKVISMKGTVKMFNKEKGFGFIRAEDGQDVFFHYSSIVMEGYKTVVEGEPVEFDVEQSDRGLRASNVRKLDAE